jgi:hypothetical protein
MRDYLVFFRAGANSLHRRLLAEDPGRNWDCCVSWYCPPPAETGAEYYVSGGDNKLEAFAAFCRDNLADLPYRRYLVVDDDILFAPGDISRLFDLCQAHDTYLCQPALRWGTHASHDVTLWNPLCQVRQTSFIEVMTPCFSREAMRQLLPTFTLTRSTWGIDYAWASLLQGQGRIAIVDSVQVAHVKPVDLGGGAFYRMLESRGIDARAEYGAVKQAYPAFGPLRTLPGGHVLASPLLPAWLGRPLVRLMESLKKRLHKRRILEGPQP